MLMTALEKGTNQLVTINIAAKARQGGETLSWQRWWLMMDTSKE